MGNATNRWLDRLAASDRAKGGTGSDYKLAQLLGIDRQQISKYRSERDQMGDDSALALAELVGVHPMVVIGDIRTERGRTEREKKFWTLAARNAKKAAVAGAVIVAGVLASPGEAFSSENRPSPVANSGGGSVYYVKSRTPNFRRFRRRKNRPSRLVPGRVTYLSRLSDLTGYTPLPLVA